ncbi:hypothetical protein, partial [Burkholderia cenocepacia]|uniref:hypothetical protein n=1 Tax=Burkholderia cenocepacia TaxID=95486 RepID=UPI00287657C8
MMEIGRDERRRARRRHPIKSPPDRPGGLHATSATRCREPGATRAGGGTQPASGRLRGRRRAAFGLQAAGDFLAVAVQFL